MNKENVAMLLRENLERNFNFSDKEFSPNDEKLRKSRMKKYYLKDAKNNCYKGKIDLKLKADWRSKSIYSSAVMIYNLFGNKVRFKNKDEYKDYNVIYEEELEAIKPEGKYKTHKAHLDASLRTEDEIIFIEAKMTEWFSNPKKLAKAYLNKECYLPIEGSEPEIFIEFFKKIIDMESIDKNGKYKSISDYKVYDAIQMTLHILGIYNFVLENKNESINKIYLYNCVWGSIKIRRYQEEEQQGKKYCQLANKYFKKVFKNLGIDFTVEYYTFNELKDKIDDIERKKYLDDRYKIDFDKLINKK